jgi:hypothetical protein
MKRNHSRSGSTQSQDKQLLGISLEAVLEKRRLDQALNAKEFAVCAGVSYSTARGWFRLAGFPVFQGIIFWEDFVRWRAGQNASRNSSIRQRGDGEAAVVSALPPRAKQILLEV